MRPSYNAPEAPTHLRAGDLPPGFLDDILDEADRSRTDRSRSTAWRDPRVEPASASRRHSEPAALPPPPPFDPDPSAARAYRYPHPRAAPPHLDPELPSVIVAPQLRTEPGSNVTPAERPAHRRTGTPRTTTPRPAPHAGAPSSTPGSAALPAQPTTAPRSVTPRSARSSAPIASLQPAAAPAAAPPAPQMPGVGAIDPMLIATPPELAGPIYSHIRRLALQADLAGADRVLRDALAELTSSLSCSIVYPGRDGLWTLGADDEIPRDAQPLVAVASARRAVIASHLALIPVLTSSEVVAVVALTRNPRQPGYQVIEQVAMVALAREAAPILHHLAVQHLQRASEIKADKGSLYRGEALEAHRTRGQEGTLVQLSPAWVKRAYPVLIVTIVLSIVFAVFVKVPTYSSGTAVVVFEGSTSVTATANGSVEKVLVKENEAVKKGDPLIRLGSPQEAAQLMRSEADWRDAEIQFLFEQTDPEISKTLKAAGNARNQALANVEARTIRAPRDGVVTNLHVKEGVAVQLGSYLLQITDENSEIEVLAFLPGKDGPRIRGHMELQLELDGYTKARAIGAITHVQADSVSGIEAAKLGGEMLAESIAKELQAGTWIAVRARLPSRTFKTEHRTYHYHHGMHAKVEVKIQSKPFLVTLLPALEKYLPD